MSYEKPRPGASFRHCVEESLEHFSDANWLGAHSPLAAPYVLGDDLHNYADADTPAGRGRVLQDKLRAATQALPKPSPTQDLLRLLDVTYFSPNVNRTRRGYAVELGLSAATYFRHRNEALDQLEHILAQQLRPGLRTEMPQPRQLIGREVALDGCWRGLKSGQLVAVTGSSGLGKSALGAVLAQRWHTHAAQRPQQHVAAPSHVFWYTFRPGFNDQLESLLFSLGLYLYRCGAPNLWLQLIAKPGAFSPELALGLLRADLALQAERSFAPPLLCFDEVDLLRLTDGETQGRARLRAFVEALTQADSARVPLLIIGQQLLVEPDLHVVLNGLTDSEVSEFLYNHDIALAPGPLERVCRLTHGNPLLLSLFAALHHCGEKVSDTLRETPQSLTFDFLLDRIRRRLSSDELAMLQALSVYRRGAPADEFAADSAKASTLDRLVQRGLAQRDQYGAVMLQSMVREAVYRELDQDARKRMHVDAYEILNRRAVFTEAASQALDAGQPALAVWTWFSHRQQEIAQGQSESALQLFKNLTREALPHDDDRRALVLLRAELLQTRGESQFALDDLDSITWPRDSAASITAHQMRGDALDHLDRIDDAVRAYRAGLSVAGDSIGAQASRLHARLGALNLRRIGSLAQARREADIARTQTAFLYGDIEEETGNYAAAREHFEEALRISQAIDQVLNTAVAHSRLALLSSRSADFDATLAHFAHARDLYMRIGERVRIEYDRANLAFAMIMAGRDADAILPATEALAFFQNSQQGYWIAQTANNLAEAFLNLGDLQQSEHYAQLALAQEETRITPYVFYTIGVIRHKQGALEQAEHALRDAIRVAQELEDRFAEAPAWRALGAVLRARGHAAEARESFGEALALFSELRLSQEESRTRDALADFDHNP